MSFKDFLLLKKHYRSLTNEDVGSSVKKWLRFSQKPVISFNLEILVSLELFNRYFKGLVQPGDRPSEPFEREFLWNCFFKPTQERKQVSYIIKDVTFGK